MNLKAKILEVSYKAGACHIGSALSCAEIVEKLNKKDGIIVFSKASGICALLCTRYTVDTAVKLLRAKPAGLGSLGHGLPIAVGMALGAPLVNIYCVMGDAELQEGTTWECLLFKRQHKLKNLHIYVDWNGYQACGKTKDILQLPEKFLKKNGFHLIKTVKGKGVSFMEGNNDWHYKNLTEELYAKALSEVI
jgi:transketolase N-terminal domain/subunit